MKKTKKQQQRQQQLQQQRRQFDYKLFELLKKKTFLLLLSQFFINEKRCAKQVCEIRTLITLQNVSKSNKSQIVNLQKRSYEYIRNFSKQRSNRILFVENLKSKIFNKYV